MESSKLVLLLLIGIYCLTLAGQAHAECCTSYEVVTFDINGPCSLVGGHGYDTCEVTICADGVARVGAYCGVRSCNIFGCNCDGGCLTGEWSKSFKEKYQQYDIQIIDVQRFPY